MEAKLNPLVKIFYWVNVTLLVVLVLEVVIFLLPSFQPPGSQGGSSAESTLSLEQLDRLSSVGSYSEAINRSLFSWNRKPKSGVQKEVDSESLASQWQLTGLVNTGVSTYAVFREIDGDRKLKLEAGMDLGSWSVESITTGQVVLTKGEESEIFLLRDAAADEEKANIEVLAEKE